MTTITLSNGFSTALRKVNVGCGFDIKPEYVNVDLNDFHGPDVVDDITDLTLFPAGAFYEVYAKDVLEHFPWRMTQWALRSWNRILTEGGRVRLITTYLPGLARRVLSPEYRDDLALQQLTLVNIFSSQSYPGDFHYTAFTERQLRYHADRCGFSVETVALNDGWLIDIVLVKAAPAQNVDLQSGSDEDVVTRLYREILRREPDPEGLKDWVGRVQDGLSRKDCAFQMLGSLEHQAIEEREMRAYAPPTLTLEI